MHKPLTTRNASILKIGGLTFCIDNGRLLIHAPGERYPFPLSGQQTHALYNLLCDYRLEIIGVSVAEQRDKERKNKERQGHKKPKWIEINGQWVEGVELSELEQEQNE